MSGRDLTSAEIEALEELADLAERDPALYRQVVSEARTEAEQREHGEALIAMFDNDTQRREERDRELRDTMLRAQQQGERD